MPLKVVACLPDARHCYAIPNEQATTVTKILTDNWICRFGVPMDFIVIRTTQIIPLHLLSYRRVEQLNHTMEEYRSKVVAEHQKDWDAHLPLFLVAYRSAVITGQTSAP
ncbi:hypothetical protein Zmor_001083 [Zophobas morio]|uniref:Uncharacterized protein n=1 Tax=Zophobas morio TaxID=2755281 RepID=A0AA38J6B0_9CUCU|nr:hypothetical protein Zmor_001083 [Zophobas morio]